MFVDNQGKTRLADYAIDKRFVQVCVCMHVCLCARLMCVCVYVHRCLYTSAYMDQYICSASALP